MSIRATFEALTRDPDHVFLQHAALTGDITEIRRLLALRADPNTTDLAGWTPLHAAASGGHADAIRELLRSGADPMRRTKKGLLASDIARLKGHRHLLPLLSAAEAAPSAELLPH
jgi:ankyrin repeat protein